MKKKWFRAALVFSFLFLLLVFPKASLAGAKSGLLLWFNTVLPTLLPFIIVSNLIIQLDITGLISAVLYPFLHRILGVSKNGCYPVLIGMLSGYPVGAKACADLVIEQKISKREGQFLLSFCNNASPMFILSFVAMQSLGLAGRCYGFLGIILFSALTSGLLFRFICGFFPKTQGGPWNDSIISSQSLEKDHTLFSLLDSSILNGFQILVKIGGYIILFSILAQITAEIHWIPESLQLIFIGMLEITTGISTIAASSMELTKKIVLVGTLTAFGGFSSLAQTKSVIADSGLSIGIYFITKAINALICLCLLFLLIYIV